MRNLQGKVAVITGAGSGIGRALALRLHNEKVVLALADINSQGLQETQKKLNQMENGQDKARTYRVDVADRVQVYELAQKVIDDFGKVDILINNAGVSSSGTVPELTYETLEWTININLWGVIYCTKAFLPCLAGRPEASIVNISSVYGLLGIPGQAAYCASKFAVRGFSESLRQELFNTTVAVTVVFPGGIQTNIVKNSRTDYRITPEHYQNASRQFEASLQTSADEAARAIITGIQAKAPRVLIGRDARKIDFLARFNPNSYDKVIAKYIRSQKASI